MSLLRKLFGIKTSKDEFNDFISRTENQWNKIFQQGVELADKVMATKINAGECVRAYEINGYINGKYGIDSYKETAQLGFWGRFKEYAETGKIAAYSIGDGDDVYVHEDYAEYHFGSQHE